MPREGFVLSLIDGTTTAEELADLSGLEREAVGEILDKLDGLGALEWVRAEAPSPSQRPPAADDRPTRGSGSPAASSPSSPAGTGAYRSSPRPPAGSTPPRSPAAPPPHRGPRASATSRAAAPDPLDEPDVDLDVERRRDILQRHARLKELDHYQVLGVGRGASRDEIRAAYFSQSKLFHPDTEFRKRLGSFRQKMEAVFTRLTEAYETLSKKSRRRDYDAYLSARDQTRAAAEALAKGAREAEALAQEPAAAGGGEPAGAPATASAGPSGDTGARATIPPPPSPSEADPPLDPPAELSLDPPPSASPSQPQPTASSPGAGTRPATATTPPRAGEGDAAARARARELAARRLHSVLGPRRPAGAPGSGPGRPGASRHGGAPASSGAGPSSPRPPPPGSSAPGGGAGSAARRDALRGLASSLRQVASVTGGVDPAHRHLSAARTAEGEGDLVSAANSVLRAMAVAPDREDLKTEHTRLRKAVAGRLADTYERQARYEEEHGHWREAADSWARVAEGRPDDPGPKLSAAEAFLEAQHDLPQAKILAEAAVALAPGMLRARRTLARVYLAAGLTKNARRELEEARKLDPNDRIINNLLEELRG